MSAASLLLLKYSPKGLSIFFTRFLVDFSRVKGRVAAAVLYIGGALACGGALPRSSSAAGVLCSPSMGWRGARWYPLVLAAAQWRARGVNRQA